MLRRYIKLLISEMKLRVLYIDVLLINVSITDGRRLMLNRHFAFIHGGHLENDPKCRIGPKILIVNILILNQGVQ